MRQLLKKMKLAELLVAATSYHGRFLKVLPHVDRIKSRPLIFSSPGALETAASLQLLLIHNSLFVAEQAEET